MMFGIGAGVGAVVGGIAKLTKGVANVVGKTASIAKSIVAMPFKGIMAGINGLKKISPLKAVGGFLSKLNPFQRSA